MTDEIDTRAIQDEFRKDSLKDVQDAFAVVEAIAGNVLSRARKTGDDYLVGGIEELVGAICALKNTVSCKIARNGIEIEDSKKREGE